MKPTLFIGNKNYSSWSLRPWLVLRWAGIAFEEHELQLNAPGYGQGRIAAVRAVSPSGTVPALHVDDLVVWDSLAIAEWAAEQVAPGQLWPSDATLRAQARAVTAEMHSGFAAVRRDLPMNIHLRSPAKDWPEDTRRGLERLVELFSHCRTAHAAQGPWLFGQRSIADAFYTPVASRLRSYGVTLPAEAGAYCATLLGDADFMAWEAASLPESWAAQGRP